MFSLKSAYNFAFKEVYRHANSASSSAPDGRQKVWQLIWKSDISPSVCNFAWRVAVDSLPTWQNKHKRGLETFELCPLCATELEDNFHPFLWCPLGQNLWHTMVNVWSLPDINMVEHTGKEWLLHALNPMSDVDRSMLLMTLWHTWFVRNEVVHHKPPPPLESSKRFLVSYLGSLLGLKTDICNYQGKGKTPIDAPVVSSRDSMHIGRWKLPDAGWVKWNTNGSVGQNGSAGAGMVLRDDKGAIIFSSCRALFSCRDVGSGAMCMHGRSLFGDPTHRATNYCGDGFYGCHEDDSGARSG